MQNLAEIQVCQNLCVSCCVSRVASSTSETINVNTLSSVNRVFSGAKLAFNSYSRETGQEVAADDGGRYEASGKKNRPFLLDPK